MVCRKNDFLRIAVFYEFERKYRENEIYDGFHFRW